MYVYQYEMYAHVSLHVVSSYDSSQLNPQLLYHVLLPTLVQIIQLLQTRNSMRHRDPLRQPIVS